MDQRILKAALIILTSLLIHGCVTDQYDVDITGIEAKVEILRLETDLFNDDPNDIPEKLPALREKYAGFLQLFSYVINTGDINDASFSDFLLRFCTDRLNNEVYDSVQKVFPDLTSVERDIEKAFRYYRYYFPDKQVPAVYTCITGFNNSIITGDSILGIGLDRYLGAGCEYYPRLGIYSYISDRMTPAHLVPDCIYGWGASEWDIESVAYPSDNVLTALIHEGKLRYYQRCMLPDIAEEILFGFSADQMKFCRNNENQMWLYLLEHDLLFSTDHLAIVKLTGEAPFTTFFTNESPGRAATWLGFRIVESYMANNPGTSLAELMNNNDVQQILEKARYSPK